MGRLILFHDNMCLVFSTNRAITIYFIFKTMNNKIHLISATWKWNGNEAWVLVGTGADFESALSFHIQVVRVWPLHRYD